MSKPIIIVGGGLSGLTLGIGLRQRGVPVIVYEAGHYPRHRVCGEFISGSGQRSLARLGLLDDLNKIGACSAVYAAFFNGKTKIAARQLPEPAVCLSRFVLDEWLAHKFQQLGGELHSGVRWNDTFLPGIVRASGRRMEPVTNGWRLFGLKVHARGVSMDADLEMHFVPAGYVGLCRLTGGDVNICGLFRSETTVPNLAQRWRDWLSGPVGSTLHSRLMTAQYEEASFSSVAGLCLRPQRAVERKECCVGDALTMIPPVTGNGMSMAFESGEHAIEPLAKYSQNHLSWDETQGLIAAACDQQFNARLRWASWLQQALFNPKTRASLLFFAAHSDWLWRGLFTRTR